MYNEDFEVVDTEQLYSDELKLLVADLNSGADLELVAVFTIDWIEGRPVPDFVSLYNAENRPVKNAPQSLDDLVRLAIAEHLNQHCDSYKEYERQSQLEAAYDNWIDNSLLD